MRPLNGSQPDYVTITQKYKHTLMRPQFCINTSTLLITAGPFFTATVVTMAGLVVTMVTGSFGVDSSQSDEEESASNSNSNKEKSSFVDGAGSDELEAQSKETTLTESGNEQHKMSYYMCSLVVLVLPKKERVCCMMGFGGYINV